MMKYYWRIKSRKYKWNIDIFDYLIADMINNEKLNPIITELFIRDKKLNISIVFITQSYFKVPKDVRLNSIHFLLWKFQIKESFNKLL